MGIFFLSGTFRNDFPNCLSKWAHPLGSSPWFFTQGIYGTVQRDFPWKDSVCSSSHWWLWGPPPKSFHIQSWVLQKLPPTWGTPIITFDMLLFVKSSHLFLYMNKVDSRSLCLGLWGSRSSWAWTWALPPHFHRDLGHWPYCIMSQGVLQEGPDL